MHHLHLRKLLRHLRHLHLRKLHLRKLLSQHLLLRFLQLRILRLLRLQGLHLPDLPSRSLSAETSGAPEPVRGPQKFQHMYFFDATPWPVSGPNMVSTQVA